MLRTLLVGILIASPLSAQPKMTPKRTDVKPFEYVEASIPFYPPGGNRTGTGPRPKMQKPLTPEESMKHFVTPEGFEVRLFASEPQIRSRRLSS